MPLLSFPTPSPSETRAYAPGNCFSNTQARRV
jgi:hypothetical protein